MSIPVIMLDFMSTQCDVPTPHKCFRYNVHCNKIIGRNAFEDLCLMEMLVLY